VHESLPKLTAQQRGLGGTAVPIVLSTASLPVLSGAAGVAAISRQSAEKTWDDAHPFQDKHDFLDVDSSVGTQGLFGAVLAGAVGDGPVGVGVPDDVGLAGADVLDVLLGVGVFDVSLGLGEAVSLLL
jgi:hypothetical protein